MGFSDVTKTKLVAQGWAVLEYVPFGSRCEVGDGEKGYTVQKVHCGGLT